MSKDSTWQFEEQAPGTVDNADSSAEKRFFLSSYTKRLAQKDDAGNVNGLGGVGDLIIDAVLQTTTGATQTIATYSTLADERAINVKATIWAREPTTDDSAKYVIEALFNRDGSSVVTSKDENVVSQFEDQAAWNVTFNISSQDIEVQVTGEGGKTIEWRCQLEVSEHG